ncbi:hypothetical protein [Companilactobacillus nantensis]|uniref:Uncharacterized protein n=1 Tax=Companilactobacillus nantensis DSM 16982 TaxID=1423774 RepID=A0A0R1WG51_9LACO|nr:hypothetical protein [Companilactobacillus nantensis]KRM16573.1 hypothetical protein FD31_GL000581 [Companilactobacillus nantensis DSM 16982]GEO64541.1 hypothetical protein LNA01_17240 [Companilactobacillus nantensis]
MKDKKDLKSKTKSEHYLMMSAGVVGVVTAIIFFIMLSRGVVNAVVTSKISSQYQDKELEVLKTDLNYRTLNFIGKVIDVSDGVVITKSNIQKYHELEDYIQARKDRTKEVAELYDGKSDYRDDVTSSKINDLDKTLLKEKNQDIYQKQRNKLDTIQIWYEQTQDADKYLSKTWEAFNSDNGSLSFKKISMVNTYYKLVKNKTVKKRWGEAVTKMDDYFANHQGESSRVAAVKQELAALKDAPLTEKYTPASVDIVSSLNSTTGASDALTQAGITGKNVLYYNSSKNTLALMTRVSGKYVAENGYSNVISSQVSSGKYTVKKLINASSSDAIITDSSNSNFGQYVSSATDSSLSALDVTNPDNTTADFNSATPVFWFKNNSALNSSIYFSNGSTIGFIYAGGTSYNNGMQISSSDLSNLMSQISSGITFYVN